MNPKLAIKILLSLLVLVTVFHLSILVGIVPYEITWGGRLKNDNEMYVFETMSLVVNLFFMWMLLIKGDYVKAIISIKIVNVVLWGFFFLFLLNTVGNILAKSNFEKYFAILTIGTAVLLLVILGGSKKKQVKI